MMTIDLNSVFIAESNFIWLGDQLLGEMGCYHTIIFYVKLFILTDSKHNYETITIFSRKAEINR